MAHRGITCDCCRSDNVTGVRWKCSVCYDYDLCNRCFHKGAHDKAHQFYRIDEKDGPWWVCACAVHADAIPSTWRWCCPIYVSIIGLESDGIPYFPEYKPHVEHSKFAQKRGSGLYSDDQISRDK